MKKITKAIIPAAGLGTRFLPQTKAMPKEMLPVLGKPVIQYAVEEAISAGITDIIIVTGSNKRAIEDHFDHDYSLEQQLRDRGKAEMAEEISRIADLANFIYLSQKGHAGNGTPILNAQHLIGDDEPFLVLWGDEIFHGETPRAVQLTQAYEELQHSVISLIDMDRKELKKYGVPSVTEKINGRTMMIDSLVEKPEPEDAPSEYASVGGYVLTPEIFPLLAAQSPDMSGEVYLSAAVNELAKQGKVAGHVLEGTWHDTGNKLRYLQAVIDVGLADEEVGPQISDFIRSRLEGRSQVSAPGKTRAQ